MWCDDCTTLYLYPPLTSPLQEFRRVQIHKLDRNFHGLCQRFREKLALFQEKEKDRLRSDRESVKKLRSKCVRFQSPLLVFCAVSARVSQCDHVGGF